MKKSQNFFIDFIAMFIAFNVADLIISCLGIKYKKLISFEFVLNVIIATICFTVLQFIINKSIRLLRKNKS